jgi:hypothetical protein
MRKEEINGRTYSVTNSGTYYNEGTPQRIIEILEQARETGQRLQLFYGDIETGRNWNEEYNTTGTIGRSTGTVKIPLLIATSRSMGGGGISTDRIIAIRDTKTKKVLYRSPNFQPQQMEIVSSDLPEYKFNLNINGEMYSRHRTEESAKRLLKKLAI